MRRSNPAWRCVPITSPSSRRAVQESRRTLHRAEDAGGQGQISLEWSVHAVRFVEEMKLTNSRVAAGLGRTGARVRVMGFTHLERTRWKPHLRRFAGFATTRTGYGSRTFGRWRMRLTLGRVAHLTYRLMCLHLTDSSDAIGRSSGNTCAST